MPLNSSCAVQTGHALSKGPQALPLSGAVLTTDPWPPQPPPESECFLQASERANVGESASGPFPPWISQY